MPSNLNQIYKCFVILTLKLNLFLVQINSLVGLLFIQESNFMISQQLIYLYLFLFNFLGPRLDFDPDIVAALDDDFDFDNPENILEDDFVLQANEPKKRCSFLKLLMPQVNRNDTIWYFLWLCCRKQEWFQISNRIHVCQLNKVLPCSVWVVA